MERLIDIIKEMKEMVSEQARMINRLDNKISSDIKRLEEKIIMLENRIENYRFLVEKRYVPAIVERIEKDEKQMERMEGLVESVRIQWSEFRSMFEDKMKEMEEAVKSQEDYEAVLKRIKGLGFGKRE